MYKLIALDLDDTILNDKLRISIENKTTIEKVLQLGIKVCIVSGRSYGSIKKYIQELGIMNLCGSLNGANITDPSTEKNVFNLSIDQDILHEIIREIEPEGIHINYYHGQKVVCREETEQAIEYMKLTDVKIEYVGLLKEYTKNSQAGKILMIDDTKRLDPIRERLHKKYSDRVNVTYSKPNFLEIYNVKASKGEAVKYISQYYGYRREDIIAIGDGENDISMLEYAGVGVAMGNSSKKVKERSDYVTYSNNKNGVAHALRRIILAG